MVINYIRYDRIYRPTGTDVRETNNHVNNVRMISR